MSPLKTAKVSGEIELLLCRMVDVSVTKHRQSANSVILELSILQCCISHFHLHGFVFCVSINLLVK